MEYLLYVQQVNILENKSYLMAKNFPQKKPTPRLKRNQAKNVDREHAGVGHMEGLFLPSFLNSPQALFQTIPCPSGRICISADLAEAFLPSIGAQNNNHGTDIW